MPRVPWLGSVLAATTKKSATVAEVIHILRPCSTQPAPSGRATVVAGDLDGPNGLAFSPDERKMYIVESRATPRAIHAYDVVDDRLANGRPLIIAEEGGTPDGFRCDIDGNLWCGWGMTPELDGVRVFAPDGAPIGHISLPERCANVCFGGRHRNRLFMAAAHSLYSLYTNAQGAIGG